MNTQHSKEWRWVAVRWAGLGAAIGAGLGLWHILPATSLSPLTATIRFMLFMLFTGGALGAAVGSLYARGGRTWFWVIVAALGVVAAPVTLLTRRVTTGGTIVIYAAAVLAVAFAGWVLLAAALHAWRTGRFRQK